jgi:hypothetical protein
MPIVNVAILDDNGEETAEVRVIYDEGETALRPTIAPDGHLFYDTTSKQLLLKSNETWIPQGPPTTTEVITTLTLATDQPEVSIPCKPLEYKKILITFTIAHAAKNSQVIISTLTKNGQSPRELLRLPSPAISSEYDKTSYVQWEILPARPDYNEQFVMGATAQSAMCCNIVRLYQTDASVIKFKPNESGVLIPKNSTFTILGVK